MKKIVSVLLMTTLLLGLSACNKTSDKDKSVRTKSTDKVETKETDGTKGTIVTDDLKQQSGLMFSARNGNSGETCKTDDYWSYTRYEVSYDGTLTCVVSYNLSGIASESVGLSDADYMKIYDFAYNAYVDDLYSDYKEDACDGESWSFTYYDSDEESHVLYSGYTYGNDEMREIQDILESYFNNVDFVFGVDVPDSGVMLDVTSYSWEALPDDDPIWGYKFVVYYDLSLEYYEVHTDSGAKYLKTVQLSQDEFDYLLNFCRDAVKSGEFTDYSEDVCDGDTWSFDYDNGSDNIITIYDGYIYSNKTLSDVVESLRNCVE